MASVATPYPGQLQRFPSNWLTMRGIPAPAAVLGRLSLVRRLFANSGSDAESNRPSLRISSFSGLLYKAPREHRLDLKHGGIVIKIAQLLIAGDTISIFENDRQQTGLVVIHHGLCMSHSTNVLPNHVETRNESSRRRSFSHDNVVPSYLRSANKNSFS